MKVVLFCGGLGLRMRDASPTTPKPMISLGGLPILVHVMKYYAHFGHKDFILCLGYKAEQIRGFFEDTAYGVPSEYLGIDDPALRDELRRDLGQWRITFADTGMDACVGERLYAVRDLVRKDEVFLANYADVLTDAPLPHMVDLVRQKAMVGGFLCARPRYSFHVVKWKDGHAVERIEHCAQAEIWLNAGYFVLTPKLFEYMDPGDELVEEPFTRLADEGKLLGYRHEGFWAPMDTFKDRQALVEMYQRGERPWAVWERRLQEA
jgi:glucose-1-phosphate cytidylyltransferase